MRSLEDLKQDFLERFTPAEAPAPGRAAAKLQKPSRAERRTKAGAPRKPALPPLDQLERAFQHRRAARLGTAPAPAPPPQGAAPKEAPRTGTLRKLVQGKGFGFVAPDAGSKDVFLHFSDLVNGCSHDMVLGMRVSYIGDVDAKSGKTRARNASIIDEGVKEIVSTTGRGGGTATRSSPAQQQQARSTQHVAEDLNVDEAIAHCAEDQGGGGVYGRGELLAVLRRLRRTGKAAAVDRFPIRTVLVPPCDGESHRRGEQFAEDPRLDDEDLIVELEERLSRESGADAKNRETFGDCLGGWTFEQALEANARLPHRTFVGPEVGLGPMPLSEGAEEHKLETPPLVMHAVRRSMYTAVASQLLGAPKDPARSYSPAPSSADLELCPSTAASSGSATPPGSTAQNNDWLPITTRELWSGGATRFQ